jgi:hypothetical protein
MLMVGAIAAPCLFPLAAEGGIGGAFAYAVLMGLCLVRICGWREGWMCVWMDGWMCGGFREGGMDGWMDGWMDG